jgi:hypothetical protein
MKVATLLLTLTLGTNALAGDRPVDLVIGLDTSNSMDGLIAAAKHKLWDIVVELGRAKPRPYLRVGLYAYGTPAYGESTGYVRLLTPLTDDLDTVYGKLTELRTRGGDEYVARVIRAATLGQPWSKEPDALKIIVVAGNEEATQDPRYKSLDEAKRASAAGIFVNTLFCGRSFDWVLNGWRRVAEAGGGQFACINQKHTATIGTPFDKKLAELGAALNQTYVGYGVHAQEGRRQQEAVDRASLEASPAAGAMRAVAKVSGQYRNTRWDLLDARSQPGFDLGRVKAADLPAEMQRQTLAERAAYLDQKATERAELQQQITELGRQRQQFLAAKRQQATNADPAFDAAMLSAVRAQAERKGMTFEVPP